MKNFRLIGFALLVLTLGTACSGNKENETDKSQKTTVETSDGVHVYYFHNERRCATCKAVEAESKKAVQELYGEDVKFSVFNLETPKGETKAEEIGASGQSLLIVGGEENINITSEAFMHAKSDPEKLKQIIKEKIDPLIK
ncbi:MAG: nitrophenyl compound nitroreductase subunit ArsF family protein [Candidatus Delongbacteria bacterium]|jgi:hypothetical protein|nr:nitrophenyl compound nitroreductase subunit ArsF family protein [Candidatus Delongbacteria bacterium]